ncbi:MAG: hypothetical protein OXC62_17215 [Aestuariivita sp.]|nr:hypothetical protein [Aestuariivita sp.]
MKFLYLLCSLPVKSRINPRCVSILSDVQSVPRRSLPQYAFNNALTAYPVRVSADDADPVTLIPVQGCYVPRSWDPSLFRFHRRRTPLVRIDHAAPSRLCRPVYTAAEKETQFSGHQSGSGRDQAIRGKLPRGDEQFADSSVMARAIGIKPLGDRADNKPSTRPSRSDACGPSGR